MGHAIDLTGQTFGDWTVLHREGGYSGTNNRHGQATWLCQCSCGTLAVVGGTSLRSGRSKTCGKGHEKSRKLQPGQRARNRTLQGYIGDAKRRGLDWELTPEEFDYITSLDCHYCGQPPSLVVSGVWNGTDYGSWTYNGIDRVDNSKGYTVSNIVPCCKMCNRFKSGMDVAKFLSDVGSWAARFVDYQGKG